MGSGHDGFCHRQKEHTVGIMENAAANETVKNKSMDHLITAVIVNHNGGKKILRTIKSLTRQTLPVSILVVDNGSTDRSADRIRKYFPQVLILPVETNTGYCHGANSGLYAVRTRYALLVDQDILCGKGMAAALCECALAHPGCYAVQARIMSEKEPDRVLTCGRQYSAFGRAYDLKSTGAKHVFSPTGAALYSMEALEEIGLFDERHYRGLHEVDLGYRALLLSGRSAVLEEKAVGRRQDLDQAPSSEAYDRTLDAGNNLYLLYKNMPRGQQILNAPFLEAGRLWEKLSAEGRRFRKDTEKGKERGHYLIAQSFQSDLLRSEGASSVKGTLEEETGLEASDQRFAGIYPLYLGGRIYFSPDLAGNALRVQKRLMEACPGAVREALGKKSD